MITSILDGLTDYEVWVEQHDDGTTRITFNKVDE